MAGGPAVTVDELISSARLVRKQLVDTHLTLTDILMSSRAADRLSRAMTSRGIAAEQYLLAYDNERGWWTDVLNRRHHKQERITRYSQGATIRQQLLRHPDFNRETGALILPLPVQATRPHLAPDASPRASIEPVATAVAHPGYPDAVRRLYNTSPIEMVEAILEVVPIGALLRRFTEVVEHVEKRIDTLEELTHSQQQELIAAQTLLGEKAAEVGVLRDALDGSQEQLRTLNDELTRVRGELADSHIDNNAQAPGLFGRLKSR